MPAIIAVASNRQSAVMVELPAPIVLLRRFRQNFHDSSRIEKRVENVILELRRFADDDSSGESRVCDTVDMVTPPWAS